MARLCSYCSEVQKDGGETRHQRNNVGLLVASLVGHENCAKVFIERRADVNCYDRGLRRAIGNHMENIITDGNPLILVL